MTSAKQKIIDYLNAHVRSGPVTGGFRKNAPALILADGVRMSVQASKFHYCTPRDNDGPYLKVEIGFPSAPLESLARYAEEPGDLTNTVYGYVPINKLADEILRRGELRSAGTKDSPSNAADAP